MIFHSFLYVYQRVNSSPAKKWWIWKQQSVWVTSPPWPHHLWFRLGKVMVETVGKPVGECWGNPKLSSKIGQIIGKAMVWGSHILGHHLVPGEGMQHDATCHGWVLWFSSTWGVSCQQSTLDTSVPGCLRVSVFCCSLFLWSIPEIGKIFHG